MDDRELNEKMAKLCGIEIYAGQSKCWIARKSPLDYVWDPANDWQQVHDYVIPALQEADCIVELEYDDRGLYMEIKPACGGWIASGAVISLELPPCSFCEVALEAFEKLEEKA